MPNRIEQIGRSILLFVLVSVYLPCLGLKLSVWSVDSFFRVTAAGIYDIRYTFQPIKNVCDSLFL